MGYIYAIGNREYGWVKIGMTVDISKRLSHLQTGCPFKLELLYHAPSSHPKRDESFIHDELFDLRLDHVDDTEWFRLDEGRLFWVFSKYLPKYMKSSGEELFKRVRPIVKLYRRHLKGCSHSSDRYSRVCYCPVWFQYSVAGKQVKRSSKLRNWHAAEIIARECVMPHPLVKISPRRPVSTSFSTQPPSSSVSY